MALVPPSSRGTVPATDDDLKTALGYLAWSYTPLMQGSTFAYTSQRIYAVAMGVNTGAVVTNVIVGIGGNAGGTAPTGAFVGICNATTMLAQSGNIKSAAGWSAAPTQAVFALSAAYTVQAADNNLLYAVVLIDGAWGASSALLQRTSQPMTIGAIGANPPQIASLGTGQTALPANGAAVVLTAVGGQPLFLALS